MQVSKCIYKYYIEPCKSVTKAINNHIVALEHKCWSNEQYSRRECLQISGIPSDTEAGKLGETILNVFEKLDVDVDPKNFERFSQV